MDKNKVTNFLKDGTQNIIQSCYDNFIESNAKLRSTAGLKSTITRMMLGECCEWCAAIAGTYEYGKEPKDIYRRHKNCDCVVIFKSEKGYYQDAHTSKKYGTPKEVIADRVNQIQSRISRISEPKKLEAQILFDNNHKTLKKFEEYQQKWYEEHIAGVLDKEESEYLSESLRNMFNDPENSFCMRVHSENLASMEKLGIKSQMETGTTNAAKGKETRKYISKQMFGWDGDIPNTDYEKYGYFGKTDFLQDTNPNLVPYGDTIIHFKKDSVVVTYSSDDSLVRAFTEDSICGSVKDGSLTGLSDPKKAYRNFKEGSVNINAIDGADEAYTEMQYHGKLTFDDVESIMITTDINPELLGKIKGRGITVYKKEGGNIVEL